MMTQPSPGQKVAELPVPLSREVLGEHQEIRSQFDRFLSYLRTEVVTHSVVQVPCHQTQLHFC
jgi:hypothetical protein